MKEDKTRKIIKSGRHQKQEHQDRIHNKLLEKKWSNSHLLWENNKLFLEKWIEMFYREREPKTSESVTRLEKRQKKRVNMQYNACRSLLIGWISILGAAAFNFIFRWFSISSVFYGTLLIYAITRLYVNRVYLKGGKSLENRLNTSNGWIKHGLLQELNYFGGGWITNKTIFLIFEEIAGGFFLLCLFLVGSEEGLFSIMLLIMILSCISFSLITMKKFWRHPPDIRYTENGLYLCSMKLSENKGWGPLIRWEDIEDITIEEKQEKRRSSGAYSGSRTYKYIEFTIIVNNKQPQKLKLNHDYYSKHFYLVSLLKNILLFIRAKKKTHSTPSPRGDLSVPPYRNKCKQRPVQAKGDDLEQPDQSQPKFKKVYCPYCGDYIKYLENYCPNCGKSLEILKL
ncbi:MAG: hypothetical protein R6U96_11570 [Promethearchaeia archaeon]